MRRGEVWWYEEPEELRHPALLISPDEDIAQLFDVIAVPITTKIRGWDTKLELGTADGISRDFTTLSAARMTEVCRVLARATGC